jgi:hypothetical protein
VNLVYNGSFERADRYLGSPDGWLHPLGKSLTTADAPTGAKACLLDVDISAPAVLLQEVAIDGARVRQVRLSGECRLLDDGGGEFGLWLRWHRYKRGGKGGRTETVAGLALSETGRGWQRVEGMFDVPEWADAAIVVVGFGHGRGSAWIDSIRLEVPSDAVASGAAVPNTGNLWDDARVPAERRVSLDTDLPRPSLLFRREAVPDIRERIGSVSSARDVFEEIKGRANGALGLRVEIPSHPSYEGDLDMDPEKERLTRPHRELLRALHALSLVYGITGDARYGDKGREILLGYARQYASYPLAGYEGDDGDDQSRLTRQVLTEAVQFVDFAVEYDLLHNALTPEEREVCEDFLRHGAHVILANHRGEGNHGCWRSAGIGLVGLALRDDKLINAELFGRWGFMRHMDWDVVDGFWYEGSMGYELYALRAMTALTEAAYNCAIDVYEGNDVYRSLFVNLAANVGPDGVYPPFNDSNYARLRPHFLRIAYARWGDPTFLSMLGDAQDRGLTALLLEPVPAGSGRPLPRGAVWPDVGQAVLRSGTGRNGSFLAVDFGPYAGFHSHYDCLTFYYYSKGAPLTVDPVAQSHMYLSPLFDGWARTTFAHATVSVDRRNQVREAVGRCELLEERPYAEAVGVATDSAYGGVTHQRALILVDEDYLLCLDRLRGESRHTYDWNYHGPGSVETDLTCSETDAEYGPGYATLQSSRVAHPSIPWQASWQTEGLVLSATPDLQPNDEVRTGSAPSYRRSRRSDALTIRRWGTEAEFAVALQATEIGSPGIAAPILREAMVGSDAQGTRVTISSEGSTDTIIYRWQGTGAIRANDVSLDGRYAWAREVDGQLEHLVLGKGRAARVGPTAVRLSRPGTLELERLSEGRYRVVWHGGGRVRLEIAGLLLRPGSPVTAAVLDADGRLGDSREATSGGGLVTVPLLPGDSVLLQQ